MSGLLFLLFNVGVVLVAHWCLKNDSASLEGVTNGLFAMTKPAQGPASAPVAAQSKAKRKIVSTTMRLPRLARRR
jgi:hypothetical protein